MSIIMGRVAAASGSHENQSLKANDAKDGPRSIYVCKLWAIIRLLWWQDLG